MNCSVDGCFNEGTERVFIYLSPNDRQTFLVELNVCPEHREIEGEYKGYKTTVVVTKEVKKHWWQR